MSICINNSTLPKSILFNSNNNYDNISLIIKGQGTFIFNVKDKKCDFLIENSYNKELALCISFTNNKINVSDKQGKEFIDTKNNIGLLEKKGIYYWFSLDAQNQRLYAGYGEARFETKTYEYQFAHKHKEFLDGLDTIKIKDTELDPIRLLRDPIVHPIPMYVLGMNEISINHIASNKIIPSASLPAVGQQLYNCVSGKNFVLNDKDFPDFSNAIEYSIKTPGLWCYNTLLEKSTEFNPDTPNIKETYLRITLNQNNGESPGVPYVMEIWPVGHYSPIHNHSNANAIIRVLHGSINVSLFPFLCQDISGIEPFGNIDFVKDDITWISKNLNQTHQLLNLPTNKKTCITIQCYMYDDSDTTHYEYFDYLDNKGKKQQYEPDSDMDFIHFKQLMKLEWSKRTKKSCFNLFTK